MRQPKDLWKQIDAQIEARFEKELRKENPKEGRRHHYLTRINFHEKQMAKLTKQMDAFLKQTLVML